MIPSRDLLRIASSAEATIAARRSVSIGLVAGAPESSVPDDAVTLEPPPRQLVRWSRES
jgi:hypothetical protein